MIELMPSASLTLPLILNVRPTRDPISDDSRAITGSLPSTWGHVSLSSHEGQVAIANAARMPSIKRFFFMVQVWLIMLVSFWFITFANLC